MGSGVTSRAGSSAASSNVALNPRVRNITGIAVWDKAVQAPNARSVTFTRVAGVVNIQDGVNPAFNLNAAVSLTWGDNRDDGFALGANLIFSGVAAGSNFIVSWVE